MTVTSLPGWGIEDANQPWSLTAPDSSTLRFELRAGDHWAIDYNNAIEQRTEINDQNLIPPNTPISISYDMTIESGVNTSGFMAIGQMHSVSEGSPPFFVKLLPGNYMAIVAEYGNGTQNRTGSGPGGEADVYVDKNPLVQGHSYHMQIDMKLSNDSTGYLHVWRDGVEIVNINGPIGYGDNAYWKEGIYRDNSPETMVIDYSHTAITTPSGTTTVTVPAYEVDQLSTGGTGASAGDSGTGTGTGTSSGGTSSSTSGTGSDTGTSTGGTSTGGTSTGGTSTGDPGTGSGTDTGTGGTGTSGDTTGTGTSGGTSTGTSGGTTHRGHSGHHHTHAHNASANLQHHLHSGHHHTHAHNALANLQHHLHDVPDQSNHSSMMDELATLHTTHHE